MVRTPSGPTQPKKPAPPPKSEFAPPVGGRPTMAEVTSHINPVSIASKLDTVVSRYKQLDQNDKQVSMTATKLQFMSHNMGKFTPAF